MWTRKAALLLTSGISLVLIGMMIANFQLMILTDQLVTEEVKLISKTP